jgi:hypothetical protein
MSPICHSLKARKLHNVATLGEQAVSLVGVASTYGSMMGEMLGRDEGRIRCELRSEKKVSTSRKEERMGDEWFGKEDGTEQSRSWAEKDFKGRRAAGPGRFYDEHAAMGS